MSFRLLHLIMVRVFGWLVLLSRSQESENADPMLDLALLGDSTFAGAWR